MIGHEAFSLPQAFARFSTLTVCSATRLIPLSMPNTNGRRSGLAPSCHRLVNSVEEAVELTLGGDFLTPSSAGSAGWRRMSSLRFGPHRRLSGRGAPAG
jgi:hypothetical protein